MEKRYYFFYLEIALRKKNDQHVYAFENVSHIPTSKLIELFNINVDNDPHLSNGYFLTKANYRKFKRYIIEHIGPINLDVFEYSLQLYVADDFKEIRKMYKEDLME